MGKISCRLRLDLMLIGYLFVLMDDLQCVSLAGDPFVCFLSPGEPHQKYTSMSQYHPDLM